MIKRKKICIVTATRAEYGLLYWLMREIKKDKKLELQIIVTGMHLSHEFGLTYKEISISDETIGVDNIIIEISNIILIHNNRRRSLLINLLYFIKIQNNIPIGTIKHNR